MPSLYLSREYCIIVMISLEITTHPKHCQIQHRIIPFILVFKLIMLQWKTLTSGPHDVHVTDLLVNNLGSSEYKTK